MGSGFLLTSSIWNILKTSASLELAIKRVFENGRNGGNISVTEGKKYIEMYTFGDIDR